MIDYESSKDKPALLAYAEELELKIDARSNLETIKSAIRARLQEIKPPKKEEQKVKIIIHKTENDSGSLQVPVSVNGKTWLIQRGHTVEVPKSVVEVLNNAIKDVFDYDERTKTIIKREVHSYPFSVVSE